MSTTENPDYLVLARKYRPQVFADLVGQDALVQTLSNAIKTNRLHHAYVLTGIRGTGKTTTARLLAMALNCENGPSIEWATDDAQCAAIAAGRHVDVLEFDAASHTGVDDIRDLFEGVAYAPVQGRYKVYIIDEVHMLSRQAFNALLKTLEEPPENVKFIFATTEVNKIPVTVLSRCQRFDLKRFPSPLLAEYCTKILAQEGIEADEASLQLIARAADGSARDALSLLDQAIALSSGKKIEGDIVGEMLGMADRTRMFDLCDAIFSGDVENTISLLEESYSQGFDPYLVVTDLLQLTHLMTKIKVVPGMSDSRDLSELEKTRAVPLAQQMGLENLSRVYQMLFQAATEAKQADRPFEAVEMALIRVTHLAPLPSVSSLLAQQQEETPAPVQEVPALVKKPVEASPPALVDWSAVVNFVKIHRPALGNTLEQKVRLEAFTDRDVSLSVDDGLHKPEEIAQDLRQFLKEKTGTSWQIKLEIQSSNETLAEVKHRTAEELKQQATEHDEIQQILEMFPGAEVVKVKQE